MVKFLIAAYERKPACAAGPCIVVLRVGRWRDRSGTVSRAIATTAASAPQPPARSPTRYYATAFQPYDDVHTVARGGTGPRSSRRIAPERVQPPRNPKPLVTFA